MFIKVVCDEVGILMVVYGWFDVEGEVFVYVVEKGVLIVVKVDGLVVGKGVVVVLMMDEVEVVVRVCFEGFFGVVGVEVVIEEFFEGEEVSFFVLFDGINVLLFVIV